MPVPYSRKIAHTASHHLPTTHQETRAPKT